MKASVLFGLGILTGIGCTAAVQHADGVANLVTEHVDAFNRKDIDTLTGNVAEDFVWYGVEGDTLRVDAEGRGALRNGMADYFRALPSVSSELEAGFDLGRFTAVAERVRWRDGDEERTQAAIAVYERAGGEIQRVWYFPEVP